MVKVRKTDESTDFPSVETPVESSYVPHENLPPLEPAPGSVFPLSTPAPTHHSVLVDGRWQIHNDKNVRAEGSPDFATQAEADQEIGSHVPYAKDDVAHAADIDREIADLTAQKEVAQNALNEAKAKSVQAEEAKVAEIQARIDVLTKERPLLHLPVNEETERAKDAKVLADAHYNEFERELHERNVKRLRRGLERLTDEELEIEVARRRK